MRFPEGRGKRGRGERKGKKETPINCYKKSPPFFSPSPLLPLFSRSFPPLSEIGASLFHSFGFTWLLLVVMLVVLVLLFFHCVTGESRGLHTRSHRSQHSIISLGRFKYEKGRGVSGEGEGEGRGERGERRKKKDLLKKK